MDTLDNSIHAANHNLKKVVKNISKFSTLNYISNTNWKLINIDQDIIYTFLEKNILLITENGIVNHCKYDIIVDNNSITITKDNITELYHIPVVHLA